MKSIHIAWAALLFLGADIAIAGNRPAGYVTICNEGKTCSVATSTRVAFGRADKFFYKELTGAFVCGEATFGGRIGGGVNECSVPKTGSASSSSGGSSSSSSSTSTSGGLNLKLPGTKCANEGEYCAFSGTGRVYYGGCLSSGSSGGCGYTAPHVFTDGVLCIPASFGLTAPIGLGPKYCSVEPQATSGTSGAIR